MRPSNGRVARALAQLADGAKRRSFRAELTCFDRQVEFLRAPGKRKVLRCSRRAGKSMAFASGLLEAVTKPPYTNVFYLAPTFKRARRILWATLKTLNRTYALGGVPNETEASIAFPALGDDVHLYLGGLKDKGEADKVRGVPGKLWVIDEAQDNREDVFSYALKEAIEPGLLDYDGEMWVGGTPGPARVGYFYDIDEGKRRDGWLRRSWTWRDNVLLPRRKAGATVEEIERKLLEEFALKTDDASWLREWCGQWVEDLNALVLQYNEAVNACEWHEAPREGWTYDILSFDIGLEDADAVGVIGWPRGEQVAHLVREHVARGQDVTDLANRLKADIDVWKPRRVVGDLGALGKKIGEELRRRFSLPVEPADKARKLEGIALLNAAMRKGEFKAPKDSAFAQDSKKLQWDLEKRAKGIAKISDRFHSDSADMVLYGFKEARHFWEESLPKAKSEAERMQEEDEAELDAMAERNDLPWWRRDALERLGR